MIDEVSRTHLLPTAILALQSSQEQTARFHSKGKRLKDTTGKVRLLNMRVLHALKHSTIESYAKGRSKEKFNIYQRKRHLGTRILGFNTLWSHHCPSCISITRSFPGLCLFLLYRSQISWIGMDSNKKFNTRMAKSQLKNPICPTPFTSLLLIHHPWSQVR